MASDPKIEIEKALRKALEQEAPQFANVPIVLERPKQADHGDFSSNVALQLAKSLKNPFAEAANLHYRGIIRDQEGQWEAAIEDYGPYVEHHHPDAGE